MTFYDRFEALCQGKGLRPQSDEIIEMTGVSSPSITGWKKGSAPKADVLIRIASYFNVSVDYLLGVEKENELLMRKAMLILQESENELSEQEKSLIAMFRSTNEEGRLRIIQAVMNIVDSEKNGRHTVYRAARSTDNAEHRIKNLSESTIDSLKTASPITSEDDL